MSEHRVHESIGTAGLADDCPGCSLLAKYPFESLDSENFKMMYERTIAWMNDLAFPRSDNEHNVMNQFEVHIRHQQRVDNMMKIAHARNVSGSVS